MEKVRKIVFDRLLQEHYNCCLIVGAPPLQVLPVFTLPRSQGILLYLAHLSFILKYIHALKLECRDWGHVPINIQIIIIRKDFGAKYKGSEFVISPLNQVWATFIL